MEMVWVVEGCYFYEGSQIIAICETPEKATEKEEQAKLLDRYDYIEVTSHMVE